MRRNVQPDKLYMRRVDGHTLYSHVVVTDAPRTIYISGQLSRDREGKVVGKDDMRAQIRQVAENLKIALEAAGASFRDLIKTTTYVTDIDEFFRHADMREEIFGKALPTSTTVEVRRLSHPDFLVEIEAIAILSV